MMKPIIFWLSCICLLASCRAAPEASTLYLPQEGKRDAKAKEFFRHVRYPYRASEARRRRIEQAAREMRLGQTEAQVLAQLGPPDWKEDVNGYPPEVSPFQKWYYVHTWKRPIGSHYNGKMILIYMRKDVPRTSDQMEIYGLQKVNE